jgi:hypothetical protein
MPFSVAVSAQPVAASAVTVHRSLAPAAHQVCYTLSGLSAVPACFSLPAELDGPHVEAYLVACYQRVASLRCPPRLTRPHAPLALLR